MKLSAIHETIGSSINEEDFSIKRMLGTAALTAALGTGGILGYENSRKSADRAQGTQAIANDRPVVQVRPVGQPKAVVSKPAPLIQRPVSAPPAQKPATQSVQKPAVQSTHKLAKLTQPTQVAPKSAKASKPTSWQDLSKFAQDKGFTVTSTTGGKHNVGSKHGKGLAIDVRTRDKTPQQVAEFIKQARAAGIWVKDERTHPPGQKVWSGPHLHLEIR